MKLLAIIPFLLSIVSVIYVFFINHCAKTIQSEQVAKKNGDREIIFLLVILGLGFLTISVRSSIPFPIPILDSEPMVWIGILSFVGASLFFYGGIESRSSGENSAAWFFRLAALCFFLSTVGTLYTYRFHDPVKSSYSDPLNPPDQYP